MSKPNHLLSPSLESAASVGEATPVRHSLFDSKDNFIERIAPVAVAAFYFGSFSLSPQDAPLSRQALYKLSFLYRQFLQPGGIRIAVNRHTAVLSGTVLNRTLVTMADILALQIEGIRNVEDETATVPEVSLTGSREKDAIRESVHYLFATDQTLRSGVQIGISEGTLTLQGEVSSIAQKNWAEQLAEAAGGEVNSLLKVTEATTFSSAVSEPAAMDDESLEALVLFRLRLARETQHVPVRVKATRGVVALQGKVRTESLRQRIENIARSTMGLRELRSTLTVSA
jgi:osmotically-inducible protein OsmY